VACAYAIPPEELSSIGLVCSAGTWEGGTRDVPWSARFGSWAATYCPSLSTRLIDFGLGLSERLMGTNTGKKLLDNIAMKAAATAGKHIPESEKIPEAVAARRARLIRIFLEPYAQGSRGFVDEAYILTHPYGFRLEDVQRRVLIWHGTKDTNSPISMISYMRDRLPQGELYELEGETHFTIMKYLEDMIVKLVNERQ
jgi:pimeloyl-ACP methyl ester carboxylesterase